MATQDDPVPSTAWPSRVLTVAHRAGNHPDSARHALGAADLIELDVHVLRRRVEVRHEKVLWPTSRLWERWYLLPRQARGVPLEDIIEAVGPEAHLMLDLKCFTRRAARRIREAVPSDQPLVISCRSWWVLSVFRERPATYGLRSCGNRLQLLVVGLVPGLGDRVGVAVHERLLDGDTISSLSDRTSLLFSWGVTTRKRAEELVDAGVHGLIVDDLTIDWPR
jgi:hypothetical protein